VASFKKPEIQPEDEPTQQTQSAVTAEPAEVAKPRAAEAAYALALDAAIAKVQEDEAFAAQCAKLDAKRREPVKVAAEPKRADAEEREEREEPEAEAKPEPVALALPGIAGEVQQYFLRTAMQPSETMSLAVGLMVPTTLVMGKVIGPSGPKGTALHQTMTVLVPTSGGKQHGIDTVKDCVSAAGAQKLLGPNRFKSGAGLVRYMKENRVALCVQDEFGLLLAKLGSGKANQSEIEINERMREFWSLGPGSIYNSPVGASKGDDSETVVDARLAILGFGNRDEFFDACKGIDVINGFLNRIVVLEERALLRPRAIERIELPFRLKEALCKLAAIKAHQLDWTAAAREIHEAEKDRVFSQTDERKLKLWSRTPEKIIRAASAIAASRFVTKVERTDMEVSQAMMQMADQVIKLGMDDADAKRGLDHAEMKLEIARRLGADFPNAEASIPEIARSFRHNTKRGSALIEALRDMVAGGIITPLIRVKTGGRDKEVHRLIDWEG
jgi:hypothetical protein